MKVIIVKEVMTCDVSPVAMFFLIYSQNNNPHILDSFVQNVGQTIRDTITGIGIRLYSSTPLPISVNPFSMSCQLVMSVRTIIGDHNHYQQLYHCN